MNSGWMSRELRQNFDGGHLCLPAPLFNHNNLQVAHLKVLSIGVSRCSFNYAQVPSVARLIICIYIEKHIWIMPCHDVANLVIVTMTNMIQELTCGCRTLSATAVRIWHEVSSSPCTAVAAALRVSHRPAFSARLLSKSPANLRRGLRRSKIRLFYNSHLAAFWMHFHNCRCFQEHLRMLLQSLGALCLAPGWSGKF